MSKTYVIVGGVAGGAGVAARLRRMDEKATIVLYEKGPYVSFANCGLPYYAGGIIQDREKLLVTPKETFTKVFNIAVHTNCEVTAISRKEKLVAVLDHTTGEQTEQHYDSLILSPGAKPFIPPLPGCDDKAVFTVRNIPDIDKVYAALSGTRKAVVVGGGFIGIEMAENLRERGIQVSLVEAAPQCMINLDYDIAVNVHQSLRNHGIELYLSSALKKIERKGDFLSVVIPQTTIFDVDMVILSIGVKPDTKFAEEAGIKLDQKGHILVNELYQTNDKDVYAIGDAIAYPSPLTGKTQAIALAGPANKMARLCADSVVTGKCASYSGTYGASIAKVFDLAAGSVGLNEKQAQDAGLDYEVAVTHTVHHASYYPGAKPLTGKIIYEKGSGKLLGGQLVGYEGVDKRIDVLSAFLSKGGTVRDLAAFEQSYAPPFNSAKDILNMLGFIATNSLDGLDKLVDYKKAQQMVENGAVLIDVRSKAEFELGAIEGAINYSHDTIRDHLEDIPKDKDVVLICAMGLRGHIASRILFQNGFTRIYNLTGGYKTWHAVLAEKDAKTTKEDVVAKEEKHMNNILTLDACGLQCPGPIVSLKNKMDSMNKGDVLAVKASDPGFQNDVRSWCDITGNILESVESKDGIITAIIRKDEKKFCAVESSEKGATIIVFSNAFDKALASFVLANGAAASGKPVTMFFTFWGLSVLRKKPNKKIKKDMMGKMFGAMLPKSMAGLSLSNMNFMGMGPKMMKSRMKKKQVDQLETMFALAKANHVRFIACQMSMDIMGITKDELLEGVEIGGVGTYMGEASKSNVNLFI
ncbi:MAG: FAD-dependent oxidoreductase [Sphaerochaetaceae bacterium]